MVSWIEEQEYLTLEKAKEKNNIREIKFRGKRIDNGEWVYGFYYQENRVWVDGNMNWGDENSYDILNMIATPYGDNFKEHEVDSKTVGQFVGTKDKNGVEIYDGDITKSDWGYRGSVEYEKFIYAKIECMISDNIEVVGNIY